MRAPEHGKEAERWRVRAVALAKEGLSSVGSSRNIVTVRLAEESPLSTKVASHGEFMATLHAIIKLHPISNVSVDDSRQSIQAGRGE